MKVDSENKKRKSLTTPINVRLKHSESLKCGLTPQKKKKKHHTICRATPNIHVRMTLEDCGSDSFQKKKNKWVTDAQVL